jgi:hypothetical protein
VSYWIRVFCTREAPQLGSLLDWATKHGVELSGMASEPEFTHSELARRYWDGLALWYLPDRGHLEFHAVTSEDPTSTFAGTLQEFRAAVTELDPTPSRKEVLSHLGKTSAIVSLNLPVSGFDTEELWTATWALVDYLIKNSGGMVYVEGEGFYRTADRRALLLELD